jgi:putative ABC transport system substrate-binding protein
MAIYVARRKVIAAFAGAAAWFLVAHAKAADRMRRIGVLMAFDENDSQPRGWLANFTQELADLGWTDGRTVRLDVRWAAGNVDRMRTFAEELVALQPDVIFASTTPVTAALQRDTSTIPIVFVLVSDPVGAGFVAGLPRPGRNITGFTNIEGAAFGGKWLGMLKEIAPRVTRVAIMFNPDTAPGGGAFFLNPFEAAARSLSVEPITMRVRSDAEIEAGITSLGREQDGLLVMSDAFMLVHRRTVISLTVRNNVPAIGADFPVFARDGGLLSYGANFSEIFRRAAPYVDRILRGANPGDLPVQAPTKYELVINLKTAKALGLAVPQPLLLAADELIE